MFNDYLDLLAHFGFGGAHPGGFNLTQTILESEIISPGDSVLDIGCGTGQTAVFLTMNYECQVTAVDNHPVMLEKARERFTRNVLKIKIIEGDAQKLTLDNNSFDLIIAESVIAFTDISKTLQELSRVLKKDGRLIMIEMTAERELSEQLQEKVCRLYGIREVLSEEQWLLKLQQVGFNKVDLINTTSGLEKTEINDINPSENIQTKFYDLWEEHQQFMEQNAHLIGFRAFKCQF